MRPVAKLLALWCSWSQHDGHSYPPKMMSTAKVVSVSLYRSIFEHIGSNVFSTGSGFRVALKIMI